MSSEEYIAPLCPECGRATNKWEREYTHRKAGGEDPVEIMETLLRAQDFTKWEDLEYRKRVKEGERPFKALEEIFSRKLLVPETREYYQRVIEGGENSEAVLKDIRDKRRGSSSFLLFIEADEYYQRVIQQGEPAIQVLTSLEAKRPLGASHDNFILPSEIDEYYRRVAEGREDKVSIFTDLVSKRPPMPRRYFGYRPRCCFKLFFQPQVFVRPAVFVRPTAPIIFTSTALRAEDPLPGLLGDISSTRVGSVSNIGRALKESPQVQTVNFPSFDVPRSTEWIGDDETVQKVSRPALSSFGSKLKRKPLVVADTPIASLSTPIVPDITAQVNTQGMEEALKRLNALGISKKPPPVKEQYYHEAGAGSLAMVYHGTKTFSAI